MAREQGSGHRRRESAAIGCDVCVYLLSFCFSSALDCRSAITMVLLAVPIEAWLVLHSSLIVFHGKVSSGSAGYLPFVRLTDRTFASPTARSCALSTSSLRKISLSCSYLRACELFHHQFLKPRKARHFPKAGAVPSVFSFARIACHRLPSESTKHVDALRESVMLPPWPPSSGPNDEATQYLKLAESKGKRYRRSLCQEAFFFQVALGRAPGVYTQCVCEVKIERHLGSWL